MGCSKDLGRHLVFGGYSDWRLPSSLNADGSGPCTAGSNCTGSEMGHMFYMNWSASTGSSFATGTNTANLALFSNVQSNFDWSGTGSAPNPGLAWFFSTLCGGQIEASALWALRTLIGGLGAVAPTARSSRWPVMGRHKHLPIYKAALDMAVHFEKLVAGFSRYHQYTLGTELREGSRAVA